MISSAGTRKIHNSLNLVVGIQILIWLITGCYMVLMDINFIRGQHLIASTQAPVIAADTVKVQPADIQSRLGPISSLRLLAHPSGPAYLVNHNEQSLLISAVDGRILPETLNRDQAIEAALARFNGTGELITAVLLETPPDEVSWITPPVWQVSFTGVGEPRLYLNAQTGELISKRHNYWQVFDLFWMLHIMDYDTRENIHNPLLQIAASLALISALSGIVLLWLSRRRRPS